MALMKLKWKWKAFDASLAWTHWFERRICKLNKIVKHTQQKRYIYNTYNLSEIGATLMEGDISLSNKNGKWTFEF